MHTECSLDRRNDFSQANDLATTHPDKLAATKARILEVATEIEDLRIGGAMWTRLHPDNFIGSPYLPSSIPGRDILPFSKQE